MTLTDPIITVRVGKSPYPRQLITTDPNGAECYWTFDRSLEPRNINPNLVDEPHAEVPEERFTFCEWTLETQWRTGTCGRSAAHNPYGLSLCWQHADSVFSHVLQQLRDGKYYWAQTEKLASALIAADGEEPRNGGGFVSNMVEAKVRERIERLIEGRGYLAPETEELLDRLIETRLQAKWGAA